MVVFVVMRDQGMRRYSAVGAAATGGGRVGHNRRGRPHRAGVPQPAGAGERVALGPGPVLVPDGLGVLKVDCGCGEHGGLRGVGVGHLVDAEEAPQPRRGSVAGRVPRASGLRPAGRPRGTARLSSRALFREPAPASTAWVSVPTGPPRRLTGGVSSSASGCPSAPGSSSGRQPQAGLRQTAVACAAGGLTDLCRLPKVAKSL